VAEARDREHQPQLRDEIQALAETADLLGHDPAVAPESRPDLEDVTRPEGVVLDDPRVELELVAISGAPPLRVVAPGAWRADVVTRQPAGESLRVVGRVQQVLAEHERAARHEMPMDPPHRLEVVRAIAPDPERIAAVDRPVATWEVELVKGLP